MRAALTAPMFTVAVLVLSTVATAAHGAAAPPDVGTAAENTSSELEITDVVRPAADELEVTFATDADVITYSVEFDPDDGELRAIGGTGAPGTVTLEDANPAAGYEITASASVLFEDQIVAGPVAVGPLVDTPASVDVAGLALTGADEDGLAATVEWEPSPEAFQSDDVAVAYEVTGPDGATTTTNPDALSAGLLVSAADLPADVEVTTVLADDTGESSDPATATIADTLTTPVGFVDEILDRGPLPPDLLLGNDDAEFSLTVTGGDGETVFDGEVAPTFADPIVLDGFGGDSIVTVDAFAGGIGETESTTVNLDRAGTEADKGKLAAAEPDTLALGVPITDADLVGEVRIGGNAAGAAISDLAELSVLFGPFEADTPTTDVRDGEEARAVVDTDDAARWSGHRLSPDAAEPTVATAALDDARTDEGTTIAPVTDDGELVAPLAAVAADDGDDDVIIDLDVFATPALPSATTITGAYVAIDTIDMVVARADGVATQGVYGVDLPVGDQGRQPTLEDWITLDAAAGGGDKDRSVIVDGAADELVVEIGGDESARVNLHPGTGMPAAGATPQDGPEAPDPGKVAAVVAAGTVTDSGGTPIEGAEVSVEFALAEPDDEQALEAAGDGDGDDEGDATTFALEGSVSAADGTFANVASADSDDPQAPADGADKIVVAVEADGFERYEATSTLDDENVVVDDPGADGGEPVDALDVTLQRRASGRPDATALEVAVTDRAGDPLAGAAVDVTDENGDEALTGTTDDDGEIGWSTATGDDVPTGELSVSADADGHQPVEKGIEVAAGETTEVEVELLRVDRVAGDDRVATAAAVADAAFPDGADRVIVTTGTNPADALVAAPLGDAVDAPVLLTTGDDVDDTTATTIQRLGADEVILVGGPNAVPDTVEDTLAEQVDAVERIGGDSRWETSALVADRVAEHGGADDAAVLAMSDPADPDRGWPDALAAANLTAASNDPTPVLLTASGELPEATQDAADGRAVTVVGGTGVIPESTVRTLDVDERLAGGDRLETARAVLTAAWGEPDALDQVWVATAHNHPDAIAAGAAAAATQSPLLPVRTTGDREQPTQQWLARTTAERVRIVGGDTAVPASTVDELTRPR